MAFRKKSAISVIAGLLGVVAIILATRASYLAEQGNFHTVTPGEAYRSAQLDRDELRHYVRKYGIRSIINLRGERPGKGWYREEIAAARELGVRHFDYGGIGSIRPPSSVETARLLKLFATAPRPVLMHCQAGADRSGLAAAIWKTVVDEAPAALASGQLSLRYGHTPFGPTGVLDSFFDAWAAAWAGDTAPRMSHEH